MSILPSAKSLCNVGFFFIKNPFVLRDKSSKLRLAVLSLDFDTFIYTFLAIYQSIKTLCHSVLFSLLPYSVPFKNQRNLACTITGVKKAAENNKNAEFPT